MNPLSNVAALLDAVAAERPFQRASVVPRVLDGRRVYETQRFGQLIARIDALAHGFREVGFRVGDRVCMFVKPGLDFPAAVFALFKAGCVPVFIDPGMGRDAVLRCVARTRPRGLVAIPPLHVAKTLFRTPFSTVELSVTAGGTTGWWGGHTLDELAALGAPEGPCAPYAFDPDEEAALLFTSGSTGPAKAAVYTHRIYTSQTRFIQQMYNIEPGEIDVPGLAVFGLFSLAMGMTVVWPEIDASKPGALDPGALVDLIDDTGATTAFGGIAIWRPVLRYCQEHNRKLLSLRRILSAGTAIPLWMHQGFRDVLAPGVMIHTPYGATESLPVASIASDEVLAETAARTAAGEGTCVGRTVPEVKVAILPIVDGPMPEWRDDLPLPVGQVGEIAVSGPVVTSRYDGDEAANQAAKVWDRRAQTPIVWHRIGDAGRLDAQGRLWFMGRKAHRVESATGVLYSNPVEEVAVLHPAVARAALLGVGARGSAEPVLAVEPKPGEGGRVKSTDIHAAAKVIAAELRASLNDKGFAAPIQRVLFHPRFPVDVRHNAKIHNESLSAWATERLARQPLLGLPGHEEAL